MITHKKFLNQFYYVKKHINWRPNSTLILGEFGPTQGEFGQPLKYHQNTLQMDNLCLCILSGHSQGEFVRLQISKQRLLAVWYYIGPNCHYSRVIADMRKHYIFLSGYLTNSLVYAGQSLNRMHGSNWAKGQMIKCLYLRCLQSDFDETW